MAAVGVALFGFQCLAWMLSTRADDSDGEALPEKATEALGASDAAPLVKIVLTGGPCGGKTTSLARLSSYLRERGWDVCTVPEAATVMFTNGISRRAFEVPGWDVVFQANLMLLQRQLEDSVANAAVAAGRRTVLLCDRGLMDGKAYMREEDWRKVLERNELQEVDIRDNRYDAGE